MNYCLWCDEELIIQISWKTMFYLNDQPKLCQRCLENVKLIDEKQCKICSRPNVEKVCQDCKKWSILYDGKDPLTKNISLYTYNLFMKEVITKWKYQGDYVLGEIFQEVFYTYFKKVFPSFLKDQEVAIVPIPLSQERVLERGFNQAHVLASFLSSTVTSVLSRLHSEKQSKKTRIERMTTQNPFNLQETINKPVILVDDIYTTGRTIRHAATLLKANGCPEVYAYTLIRG